MASVIDQYLIPENWIPIMERSDVWWKPVTHLVFRDGSGKSVSYTPHRGTPLMFVDIMERIQLAADLGKLPKYVLLDKQRFGDAVTAYPKRPVPFVTYEQNLAPWDNERHCNFWVFGVPVQFPIGLSEPKLITKDGTKL